MSMVIEIILNSFYSSVSLIKAIEFSGSTQWMHKMSFLIPVSILFRTLNTVNGTQFNSCCFVTKVLFYLKEYQNGGRT